MTKALSTSFILLATHKVSKRVSASNIFFGIFTSTLTIGFIIFSDLINTFTDASL